MSGDCDGCNDVNDVFGDYVTIVLLSISIGCATASLITFLVFSEIRTYPIKLICYLCITIMIGFSAFIAASQEQVVDNYGACFAMALLVHFFFIANFCWTFCIAFNFYQMIVRRNRESQLLEKWYHLFSWGLPSGLITGVGAAEQYGAITNGESGQCWITDDLARFLTFFIPGLIIISSNGVLFFFIAREIHETLAGAPKSDQRNRKKEFRVYISIYASIGLSWVFGYLMFLVPQDVVITIFLILFTITTPLQGFFIFLFYCMNKKVAAKWAGLFGYCIPACKRLEESWTTTTPNGGSASGQSRSAASSRSGIDSASSASSM
jgi:G protein-coupled receptor 64